MTASKDGKEGLTSLRAIFFQIVENLRTCARLRFSSPLVDDMSGTREDEENLVDDLQDQAYANESSVVRETINSLQYT